MRKKGCELLSAELVAATFDVPADALRQFRIAGCLDESEQLDTELKKSTAKGLLKMAGTKAITFEDVAGVGDEARVSDDGTVYVRVDNLTFLVSAYKGPSIRLARAIVAAL